MWSGGSPRAGRCRGSSRRPCSTATDPSRRRQRVAPPAPPPPPHDHARWARRPPRQPMPCRPPQRLASGVPPLDTSWGRQPPRRFAAPPLPPPPPPPSVTHATPRQLPLPHLPPTHHTMHHAQRLAHPQRPVLSRHLRQHPRRVSRRHQPHPPVDTPASGTVGRPHRHRLHPPRGGASVYAAPGTAVSALPTVTPSDTTTAAGGTTQRRCQRAAAAAAAGATGRASRHAGPRPAHTRGRSPCVGARLRLCSPARGGDTGGWRPHGEAARDGRCRRQRRWRQRRWCPVGGMGGGTPGGCVARPARQRGTAAAV